MPIDNNRCHADSPMTTTQTQSWTSAQYSHWLASLKQRSPAVLFGQQPVDQNLNDGVKMNYGRFGDLLDSVKVVTGGTSDD